MTGRKKKTAAKRQGRSRGNSAAKLDKMIEEAIVDAYGESEQTAGFTVCSKTTSRCRFRRRCSASKSRLSG